MLGDALKASIETRTLTPENNMTEFYFTAGGWCQILPKLTDKSQCLEQTTGINKTLSSKLDEYYIHLRQSYIVAH
jgi:hypothetical protein